MAEWDTGYSTLAVPAAVDDLLIRDVSATPPSGGTLKRVTWEQAWSAAAADIARVITGGHSYAAGYLTTETGERWATRLAAALHAEEVTYAVTDAALALDDTAGHSGGYPDMLHAFMPRATGGTRYTARTSQPYLPMSPLNVLFYGINDLTYLTSNVATNIAWFKMALRAVVCMARAGGWFDDTHSSCAYGGTGGSHWSANTGADVYGTATNHQTTTLNDTVTITTPADFPGGEVDVFTLAFGGASGGGSKWSSTADGGTAQVLDGTSSAFGAANGRANVVVQRVTGPGGAALSAGAHTIVVKLTGLDSTATAFFLGWAAPAPAPGLTVLCNQPAVPSLPLTAGGPHTPITSSDVTSLNAAITALAAEFSDGLVVVGDVAGAFAAAGANAASGSPGSGYVSDNLHFSSLGHAIAAKAVLDAVRAAPLTGVARFAPSGMYKRQVGAPLEPQLEAAWAAEGDCWFGKDRAGNTHANMSLVRTGAPSLGDLIMTLPPGYQPGTGTVISCGYWNAGFTDTFGDGLVGVNANQEIQWYHGDPTAEFFLCGSWPADGLGA